MTLNPEHTQGIDTVAELTQALLEDGIDLSLWGKPGAKSVADLLDEINAGESELKRDKSGQLWRIVNGLGLDVFASDYNGVRHYLVEDRQVFIDGSVLRREISTSIGEKIKAGEQIEDVVARALIEELGVSLEDGTDIEVGNVEGNERPSNSYPGLRTVVIINHVTVEIPEEQYKPEGYYEVQPGRKTTYFVWRPVESTQEAN